MSSKKILLAFDSFKGSMTSRQAADAATIAIREHCPTLGVETVAIADGGEGLLAALEESLNLTRVFLTVTDSLGQAKEAFYLQSADRETAFIESAQAVGLADLTQKERNPLHTTALGVGEMACHAIQNGAKRVFVGLGGTSTNEAGLSVLQALGFRFFDRDNRLLGPITGEKLSQIARIDGGDLLPQALSTEWSLACDVDNPFTGPRGAARIYGPQKGADANEVEVLEAGMRHVEGLIQELSGIDLSNVAGAGAAGGIAGGLHALLGAKLQPGIDIVLDAQDFDRKLHDTVLVITGEGKSDAQTLMGKAPAGVLQRAQRKGIPVLLLSGTIEYTEKLLVAGFMEAHPITPCGQPLEEAMKPAVAAKNLQTVLGAVLKSRSW